MPELNHILAVNGNELHLVYDNGNIVRYLNTGHDLWINSNGQSTNPPTGGVTTPPGSGAAGSGDVTAQMIEASVNSVGGSTAAMLGTAQTIAEMFNEAIQALEPGQFSTKARLAAMVGECAQESMWFQTTSELDGEIKDYAPYYGRGFIQLTHADNYRAFGNYLKNKGLITDANMFVNNPGLVSELKWAAYGAVYYFTQVFWGTMNLVQIADSCGGETSGDWSQVSRAINLGNPYSTREAYHEDLRDTAINAVLIFTEDPSGGNTNSDLEKVRRWGLDHIGYFYYSQDGWTRSHMMESGGGDCSSFFVYCYSETLGTPWTVFGGNSGWPGYTGSLAVTGKLINTDGNESQMRIGDSVLLTWSGYNPNFDHVALYIGNNQVLSHGGGYGPKLESLSGNIAAASHCMIRRYI